MSREQHHRLCESNMHSVPAPQASRRRKVKAEESAEDAVAAAVALEARLETAGQPAAVFVEGGLLPDQEGIATAAVVPAGNQEAAAQRSKKTPSSTREDAAAAPAPAPPAVAPAVAAAGGRKGRGRKSAAAGEEAASGAAPAPVQPGTKGVGKVASARVRSICMSSLVHAFHLLHSPNAGAALHKGIGCVARRQDSRLE